MCIRDSAYTEAVKAPKQPKSGKMDEMSSKKKMEKGLYKEVTTGAEMDLHQIADYIGAGDPFWMLVGGVFAIAGGIITAGEIGPKMKGWYNALKQKDSDSDGMQNEGDEQSQAAQIVDLAREVGIRL